MHKCAQKECKNRYSDVVGVWSGGAKGATCLPCFYAGRMQQEGQTPEQIEGVVAIFEPLVELLARTGWTWEQLRYSYANVTVEL